MKLLFEYKYIKKGNWYHHHFVPLEASEYEINRFTHYLYGSLSTIVRSTEECDFLLADIDQVERGAEAEIIIGLDCMELIINQSGVQVNIDVEDAWCYQPEGKFTFHDWKVALTGWKRLLAMPESEDSNFEMDM